MDEWPAAPEGAADEGKGSVFARGVEDRDHVFEIHAGAVKGRERQREFGVAGLDRNGKARQVLQERLQVRRAVPGERRKLRA